MGPHPSVEARHGLRRLCLTLEISSYLHGRHPDDETVTSVVNSVWLNRPAIHKLKQTDEVKFLIEEFDKTSYAIADERLGTPIYVVSNSILSNDGVIEGRGFYLVGEDGVSSSHGNDPDDINSWDRKSGSYYDEKGSTLRFIRNVSIASVVAFFSLYMLIIMPQKKGFKAMVYYKNARK